MGNGTFDLAIFINGVDEIEYDAFVRRYGVHSRLPVSVVQAESLEHCLLFNELDFVSEQFRFFLRFGGFQILLSQREKLVLPDEIIHIGLRQFKAWDLLGFQLQDGFDNRLQNGEERGCIVEDFYAAEIGRGG